MPSESVTLDVDGARYSGRLNEPDDATDQGVLVLPGMGHGPFGDVFDQFAQTAAEAGHRVARFETWEGTEDLDEKSEADMERELAAAVEFLREQGCSTVSVVAKSFGGRLALTHLEIGAVDRLVLWAPAVFVGEQDDRPSITTEELADIDVPVRILQGDEDEGMSVENARALAEHLPEADVVVLPEVDHSFQTDQSRTVEETLGFLSE